MTKRLSRLFALALGMSLVMGILAACGSGTTGTTTTSSTITIKIATELPVSGADASSGKPAENGAHMAVDEANADPNFLPGYKFEFDPQDDVGASGIHDPSVGAKNVTSLISDALVAGIVGPFNSNVAKSEMPITNQAPIVQISPANTNTCLTQEGADIGCSGADDLIPTLRPTGKVTYFRVATTDSNQGPVGADFAFKKLNLKSVYIIDDTEVYGTGLAAAFEKEFNKLGGKVLGHDSIKSTTDYTQELTKIAAAKPDVIYFAGLDSTGGINIRKQMVGIPALANVPFIGGDGLQTSSMASAIGTGKGGPVYATVATVDPTQLPSAKDFLTKYNAKYPNAYGAYAAAGYDCAKIILLAVKAAVQAGAKAPTSSADTDTAKTFRQAVIDQVAKIDYNGVTGHQSFDKNGDTSAKTITIFQLADVNGKPDWKYADAITL
ncbi:MAG TPA: branched-chain amino acid ABC transporter substrate-binding protein [Ktedonobacteraceae bacterium]|nr:branched-chain amino acid ABC transporter substrate-binding protein [Ktedonobacteraceae bacterium]